jgi:beta-N-acetylhexosaminidase
MIITLLSFLGGSFMFLTLAVLLTTQIGSMTLDEKVQELFIIPACPMRKDQAHLEAIQKLQPGGILLKQSQTPLDQVTFLNKLNLDVIRCADAEWGLSMRIKEGVVRWPKNLTLGAIQDLQWLTLFGAQVGVECRAAGIDLNFAPVLDSPENPAIGMRSFGDNTAKKAIAVMAAMQKSGVAGAAKHYPSLQKSTIDPHTALPVIERLDLASFKEVVDAGVQCIMTTHVMFDQKIVTFSPELVENIVRKEWKFEGLIITDAMNMKALQDTPGENAVRALEAGHDLLVYGSHIDEAVDDILYRQVPEAQRAIKMAVLSGRIAESALNERVARILKFKETLHHPQPIPEPPALNSPKVQAFKEQLFEQAITLVGSLPPKDATVVSVTKVTPEIQKEIKELQRNQTPYVVVLYTSPYALSELGPHEHVLVAYEDQPEAHQAIEKVLTGKLVPKGILPIDAVPAVESASR